uniref:protein MB21D2 n=1 Tax=Ciona intestinalis TaxID=7719 RepID=UPI0000523F57|nr:protein MB21D2 [Ciona intestinalis]|eukprot:XP_002129660.1 protein MB21D2 [Ciona intestinalis]
METKHGHQKLDFRSGCSLNRLENLINVFDEYDRHEFDDQMAMEVHIMKEHIFNILGDVQKLDNKLPVANEYLLLSGSARDGTLDIEIESPSELTRGNDFDLDYTLFVPVLKLHDRNQPVVLDMRHSIPCHSWISLKLFDDATVSRWEPCCKTVEKENETGHFLSPPKVCDWFHEALVKVSEDLKENVKRGQPKITTVQQSGVATTIILASGGTRIMYDLVPVVSFRGWPAVAMGWLSENHFWDGIIPEEEVITGFHLVPACSLVGDKEMEWRLSFARSEVQLKRFIPMPFMKTFYAFKAIMNRALGRYNKIMKPYILRGLLLWACDRVKIQYLANEDIVAECLLGLIDDTLQCLLSRSCPNYFIPQYNMIGHLDDQTVLKLCQVVLMVRSDPAEHVRNAVDQVKAARELTEAYHNQQMERKSTKSSSENGMSQSNVEMNSRQELDLAEKMRRLVDSNPGKSISVFLNPDDNSQPHFRIDGKFF